MGFGLGILMSIFVGFLAGFIAEKVTKSDHGIVKNIVVGILGGLVGAFLANAMGVQVRGFWGVLIASAVGAIVVLWLVRVLRGRA